MRRVFALAAVALVFGCSVDEAVRPVETAEVWEGTLAVDVRGAADVRVVSSRSGLLASLTVRDLDVAGLFPMPLEFEGEGSLEGFPEARLTLTTATAALPSATTGPCAGKPIALALSLSRRGDEARASGSLTAYCGEKAYGVPARIFRLTGDLPRQ